MGLDSNLANKVNVLCQKIKRLGNNVSVNSDGTINLGTPSTPVSTIFMASDIKVMNPDFKLTVTDPSTGLAAICLTTTSGSSVSTTLGGKGCPVSSLSMDSDIFLTQPNDQLFIRDSNGTVRLAITQDGGIFGSSFMPGFTSADIAGMFGIDETVPVPP